MKRIVVYVLVYLAAPIFLNAQCDLSAQLLVPPAERSKNNGYATRMDSYGDFLIVGEQGNDSLEFESGLVHVYNLNSTNQWSRIAKLSPSDPQEFGSFGNLLTINQSTIATIGNQYDDEGDNRPRIYIYEKPLMGDWTTGVESYSLVFQPGEIPVKMELSQNYLAVAYYKHFAGPRINLYRKQSGIYTFLQTILAPTDPTGNYGGFGERLVLTDELLVVSGQSDDDPLSKNYGSVLVYERTGEFWNSEPDAALIPSDRSATNLISFGSIGSDVLVLGNTIMVGGINHQSSPVQKTIYVYERPTGGWAENILESTRIDNGPEGSYERWKMVGNDNYLFVPDWNLRTIAIHKRTGATWADETVVNTIPLPEWTPFYYASDITLTGNHLVVGQGSFGTKQTNDALIIDYVPDGLWENGEILNQKKGETSISASYKRFGEDLAVKGAHLAVGAPYDDDNGFIAGAVYTYHLEDGVWKSSQKVIAPAGHEYDLFGFAVELSDDKLFVGAPGTATRNPDGTAALHEVGMVHVYTRSGNNWIYQTQIYAPMLRERQGFAKEITYHKGYLAVAEYFDSGTGYQGYVHLYKEESNGSWTYQATFHPSDLPASDSFGRSIAMDDSTIVIGTGFFQTHVGVYRKAYVFLKKGTDWMSASEDAQLSPGEQVFGTMFGFSVALQGDQIVVGSPRYSAVADYYSDSFGVGAAYVFSRPAGGWKGEINETAKLQPSDPSRFASFGVSVAINEENIYVGAPHTFFDWNVVDNITNDDGKVKPGAVYRYVKDEVWTSTSQEDEKITSTPAEFADMFGSKVLLKDGFLFVTGLFDDTQSGFKTGSVLTFPQAPVITEVITPCVEDGAVTLEASPAGGTWHLDGLPDQTNNAFSLPAGNYTATYSFGDCESNPRNFSVVSNGLTVNATNAGDLMKCKNSSQPLILNSTIGASNYSWYYKETQTGTYSKIDDGKSTLVATQPGFYYASIGLGSCTPHQEYFHLTDEPVITVKTNPQPVICSEELVHLQASPVGGTWSSPASASGTVDPATLPNGEYNVEYLVVTPLGCEYADQLNFSIEKLEKPEISASGSKVCIDEPVTIAIDHATAGSDLKWYVTTDSKASISGARTIDVNKPGTYYVTTSKFGCSQSSEAISIEAKSDTLFIPNVVTPNGDDKNEYFEIEGEGISAFQLSVVNRYGARVYSTNDPNFKWFAEDASAGVYFFHVKYKNCSNQKVEKQGYVQVLH